MTEPQPLADQAKQLTLEPIGYVRTAAATKVEAARQPRASGGAPGRIELLPGPQLRARALRPRRVAVHLGAVLVRSQRRLAAEGAAAAQPLGTQGRVRDAFAAPAESARAVGRAPRARRRPHAARQRRRHARRHAGARHQAVRGLHGRDRRRRAAAGSRMATRRAIRSRRSRCSGTPRPPSKPSGSKRARA